MRAEGWRSHQAICFRGTQSPATPPAARAPRPRRSRAAEKGDELAPPHSITSSACSRIDVGNTIPNLFAVLRLATSTNFVGNSAGTSLGFEPRNTLATIGAL